MKNDYFLFTVIMTALVVVLVLGLALISAVYHIN